MRLATRSLGFFKQPTIPVKKHANDVAIQTLTLVSNYPCISIQPRIHCFLQRIMTLSDSPQEDLARLEQRIFVEAGKDKNTLRFLAVGGNISYECIVWMTYFFLNAQFWTLQNQLLPGEFLWPNEDTKENFESELWVHWYHTEKMKRLLDQIAFTCPSLKARLLLFSHQRILELG